MDQRILDITGWMSPVELECLYEVSLKVPPNELVVEIGAWMGRSSAAIYAGAQGKNPVVSIDTWQGNLGDPGTDIAKTTDIFQIYLQNMRACGFDPQPLSSWCGLENKCYYVVGDSLEIVRDVPDGSIAWLFYDGEHRTTGENIDAWMPKIELDGLLTGHDYFGFYEYIQQEIHKRFYIHQIVDSIWVRYVGLAKPVWL